MCCGCRVLRWLATSIFSSIPGESTWQWKDFLSVVRGNPPAKLKNGSTFIRQTGCAPHETEEHTAPPIYSYEVAAVPAFMKGGEAYVGYVDACAVVVSLLFYSVGEVWTKTQQWQADSCT